MAVGVVSILSAFSLLRSCLIYGVGVYAALLASASSEGGDWDWCSGCCGCVVELG